MSNFFKNFATALASAAGTLVFMLLVYAQLPLRAPAQESEPEESVVLAKKYIVPPPKPREQVTIETDRNRLEAQGKAFLAAGRSPKELPPLNAYTESAAEFTEFLGDFAVVVFDPAAKKYLGTLDLRGGTLRRLSAAPAGSARRIYQQELISAALAAARSAGHTSEKVELFWQPSQVFDDYLTGKRLAVIAGLNTEASKVRELRMKYRRQGGRPCATVTSVVFTDGREVAVNDSES
jgi:hypothetical protein